MTSFALVIWAYKQSDSALSTVGILALLSTDALCVWCVGAVLGWLPIPLLNANLDVLFRTHIPVKMQGRVYAARNSLQFSPFAWVSPWWRARRYRLRAVHGSANTRRPFLLSVWHRQRLRRAFLFLVLDFLGVAVFLCFRRSKLIRGLEANDKD